MVLLLSSGCSWLQRQRDSSWEREEPGHRHRDVVCDPCYGYQPACWRPWSAACPPCQPPYATAMSNLGVSRGQEQPPREANPTQVISVPAAIPVPPDVGARFERGADGGPPPGVQGEPRPGAASPFYDERAGLPEDAGMPLRGL
jgi:hypothetical protein